MLSCMLIIHRTADQTNRGQKFNSTATRGPFTFQNISFLNKCFEMELWTVFFCSDAMMPLSLIPENTLVFFL